MRLGLGLDLEGSFVDLFGRLAGFLFLGLEREIGDVSSLLIITIRRPI